MLSPDSSVPFPAPVDSFLETTRHHPTRPYLEMYPHFLILGAAKSGTTSLARNLGRHPDIFLPTDEKHYFSQLYDRGAAWYESFFPTSAPVAGEKSPSYLFDLSCHARMHAAMPEAKLIAILREPVSRAYSNWNMRRANRRLVLEGLHYNRRVPEKTIDNLDFPGLVDHFVDNYEEGLGITEKPLDLIGRSLYIRQLESVLDHFDRSQLLVLIAEEMFENEQRAYETVLDFLGVEPHGSQVTLEKHRVGTYVDPIPESAAIKLREFLRPFNEELYRFLGHRVDHWEGATVPNSACAEAGTRDAPVPSGAMPGRREDAAGD